MKLTDLHLVLFLTRGASLEKWDHTGSLARELYLYKELAKALGSVTVLSYGDERELGYLPQLEGIQVAYNRWRLPLALYVLLLPFLHWRLLRKATIFKTNQIRGAEVALWAKMVHRKALIVRCGYVWSRNAQNQVAHQLKGSSWEVRQARWIERLTFSRAELGVTTNFSFLRGGSHAHELVAVAARLGLGAIRSGLMISCQCRTQWPSTLGMNHRRDSPRICRIWNWVPSSAVTSMAWAAGLVMGW